jgi:hypothetical protein
MLYCHTESLYIQLAEAPGVKSRGGERGNQYQSGNVTNVTMAPSQEDHAEALGVVVEITSTKVAM